MSSTPKHMTPNYRLVTRTERSWDYFRNCYVSYSWSTWEPMPLRADRKDLTGGAK